MRITSHAVGSLGFRTGCLNRQHRGNEGDIFKLSLPLNLGLTVKFKSTGQHWIREILEYRGVVLTCLRMKGQVEELHILRVIWQLFCPVCYSAKHPACEKWFVGSFHIFGKVLTIVM